MKRPLTKRYWCAFLRRAAAGMPTKPLMCASVVSTSTGTRCLSMRRPNMPTMRWRKLPPGKSSMTLPPEWSVKAMSGWASAMRSNSLVMLANSVWLDFKNLRRAGMLKNKLRTAKLAPAGQATGSWQVTFDPSMQMLVPRSLPCCLVRSSTWATAAIEASASPRKPMVRSANRSVAC